MRHTKADDLRIASRRAKIARLVLTGIVNQYEIAERLGLDAVKGQVVVSRDLDVLNEQWKVSGIFDLDAAKGKECARLEVIETEAWAAWERSKIERQSTRTRHQTGGRTEQRQAEVKKEQRDGNPRYLEVVRQCIADRRALLGLDAPKQIRHGGADDAPPIRFQDMTDAEARDRLRFLQSRFLGRLGGDGAAEGTS